MVKQISGLACQRGAGRDELIEEYPVESGRYYYIKVEGFGGDYSTSDRYHLRAKNYPTSGGIEEDEYEPNDSFSSAERLNSGERLYANIHAEDDDDYFKFTIDEESEVYIYLSSIPSGTDYDIRLYDSDEDRIASSTNGDNDDEEINEILDSGTYYIRVYTYSGFSENTYRLELDVEPVTQNVINYLNKPDSAWYSQWTIGNATNAPTVNTNNIDITKFPSVTSYQNMGQAIKYYGCMTATFAMALTNMDAETINSYRHIVDYSNGNSGSLRKLDPDIVSMAWANGIALFGNNANISFDGSEYNVNGYNSTDSIAAFRNDLNLNLWENPQTGNSISLTRHIRSDTLNNDYDKAAVLAYYLNESKYGIHVQLEDYHDGNLKQHSILFYDFNYDDYTNSDIEQLILHGQSIVNSRLNSVINTSEIELYDEDNLLIPYEEEKDQGLELRFTSDPYDNYFIVCDPATSNASQGSNKKYPECYTFTSRGWTVSDWKIIDVINY